jgi:glycerophosphoryl diester phosphodiesterase
MTRLGDHSPLRRVPWILRGLVRPRPALAGEGREIRVIGHRGLARQCPENTVKAFTSAIELGADAIETDVCVTRDGVFVIWHDADPNAKIALVRQAGGEGLLCVPDAPPLGSPWRRPVSELSFEEFRARYGYSAREDLAEDLVRGGTAPRIPFETLQGLFDWCVKEPRLRDVYLDVKLGSEEARHAPALCRTVREFCEGGGGRPRFHLLTPKREIAPIFLRELPPKQGGSGPDVYPDFELPGAVRVTRRLGARNVSIGTGERWWAGFRAEVEAAVRARRGGLVDSVVAWTVNGRKRLSQLVAIGVDGIVTDDVEILRGLVGGSRVSERESAAAGARRTGGAAAP